MADFRRLEPGGEIGGTSGKPFEAMTRVANALAGLQRLQMGAEELELKGLRKAKLLKELSGPSEREKWTEQQRSEQVKGVLGTLNQLWKESSPASQKVIAGIMGSLEAAMSPFEKSQAKMIISHSPLNPIAQKTEWWDQTMKAPKVTADPKEDPYAYAVQVFALDDYQQQRRNFTSGTPINRVRIKGLADGVFAVRGDNDKVSVVTSEQLRLEQIAEDHGTSVGALLASNGFVFGPTREVMVKGVRSNVRSVYDALERKAKGVEITPTEGAISDLKEDQADLQDFLAAWAGKDTSAKTQGSRVYKAAQSMLDEGVSIDEILVFVKSVYPGWNFRLEDMGKKRAWSKLLPWYWFWDAYAEGEKERIVAWPGNALQIATKDGQVLVYHDSRTGRVFAPNGKLISNDLDEVKVYFGGKTVVELKSEAKGKAK